MILSFAIIENGVVTNLADAEEAFGYFMGWILAVQNGRSAKMGDLWDGTNFTTPPPPMPTLQQCRQLLSGYLDQRETDRRNALCDQILAANPSINSVSSFVAAVESWPWE